MSLIRSIGQLASIPALLWLASLGCAASHHPTTASELGRAGTSSEMLAVIQESGPIDFESVRAANWVVPRSGLINLDHPNAKAAGLEDGDEPIGIYFHVLRHPQFGTFIVDTGVESGFEDPDGNPRVSSLVESAMRTEDLEIHTTTADWLAAEAQPLAGVFLTHLHLDHVMGIPDLSSETPLYAGPGEPGATGFLNLFSAGTIDRMLASRGPLREWAYEGDRDERFTGLVDIFGDGSVWAIHVPGHSPGSTAYLVRSTHGTKLLVGDACHTRWGWENGVEPGTFSADQERSVGSLAVLRTLASEYPEIEVYLGHQ